MTPNLGMTTAPGMLLAPFVPSPEALVDCMLGAAGVGAYDTVYDLGAGDGRIVMVAAQRFGARAVGVELDDWRFALSAARIRYFGLESRARIIHGDLFFIDLRPASVVTLYLSPVVNAMLRPLLQHQLRSGARVVTLDFPIQGWIASKILPVPWIDGSKHSIYLYVISQIKNGVSSMANSETSGSGRTARSHARVQKLVF